MARFYWSERWNVFRLQRRRLRWLDGRVRGPLRPAPPDSFFFFFGFPAPAAAVCRQGWAACRRTYPWPGRIVKQPPNTGIAAGLRWCPCEIAHENTTPVGSSTPRFCPVRRSVFLMSDFKLGIVRLGRVAGKVSWIPALPCASQGKRAPLGLAKTITKKKHICGIGTLCWRLVDRFGSRRTYSNAVLVSRCQF